MCRASATSSKIELSDLSFYRPLAICYCQNSGQEFLEISVRKLAIERDVLDYFYLVGGSINRVLFKQTKKENITIT